MNCPRDNSELETMTVHGTPVEKCPACAGMFVKHGALNRIAESTAGDLEFSTVDSDTFQHEDIHGATACPNDGTVMRKVDFLVDTSIILDYCNNCEGFWLDGDELGRINAEVKRLNAVHDEQIPDPLLVRVSRFLWNLPIPY
jgi:Zn-finger nucleic acid-binding protein